MRELPNWDRGSSEELIELTADQKAVTIKSIAEAVHALNFFLENIKKDKATTEIRYCTFGLAQKELETIGKVIGYDKDIEKDKKFKNELVRNLNKEIDELRKGASQNVVGLEAKLYELSNKVEKWWTDLGFLLAKCNFTAHRSAAYLNFELSVYINFHGSSFDPTPVTTEEKIRKKIFDLSKELELSEGDRTERHVLDTENNRNWFIKTLTERFPEVIIHEWKSNGFYNSKGRFQIREIRGMIPISNI